MKVSNIILEKIKDDLTFRLQLALALNISERQVQNLGKKNSENLTKYTAVEFYKSQGLSEDEIFEKEDVKSVIDAI